MERARCTCNSPYELCPACTKYERDIKKKTEGPLVQVYGKKRHSSYSKEQILHAHEFHTLGLTRQVIAERLGVPYASIHYILAMELVKD